MSLLDSLCDEKIWSDFYDYRSTHGSTPEKELEQLSGYIAKKRYLPLAQTLGFSLPQKKLINKNE